MKLFVWKYCVNQDWTAGDLCVMAASLDEARQMAADACARGEFTPGRRKREPWADPPDRVLSGETAVHASEGGG